MGTNKSFSTETSERYSRALFEVSKEAGELEKIDKFSVENNQKDANFKFQKGEQDSELKTATEELDELNTKKKELDEVVADFINCRNGR